MKPEFAKRVKAIQASALKLLKSLEATHLTVATAGKSGSSSSLESRLRAMGEGIQTDEDGNALDVDGVVEYALRMVDVLQARVDVQVSDEMYMERVKADEAEAKVGRERDALVSESVQVMLGNVLGVEGTEGAGGVQLRVGGNENKNIRDENDGFVSFMESKSEVKPQREFADEIDNSNARSLPRGDGLLEVMDDVAMEAWRKACVGVMEDGRGAGAEGTLFPHPLAQAIAALDVHGIDDVRDVDSIRPREPLPMEETPLLYVDTVEDLEALGASLRDGSVVELAVDLEAHNYRSFQGFCCLMQLSTRDRDVLVDVLRLRKHVGRCLGPVFADGKIVKVLHGSNGDIGWLQRDFGVYVCTLFDTGVASKALKYESNGLGYLLERLCGFKADKRWQLADWRIRPLHAQAIHYARADTHFLLYCYDVLRRELAGMGGNALAEVWEDSRRISLTMYEKEMLAPGSFYEIYQRMEPKSGALTERQLSVFAAVYEWRDRLARSLDESPGYLLPRGQLYHLARKCPKTKRELDSVMKTKNKVLFSRSSDLLAVIGRALKDTSLARKALNGELAKDFAGIGGTGDEGGASPEREKDESEEGTAVQKKETTPSSLYSNLGIAMPMTVPAPLRVVQKNSLGNMAKTKAKRPHIPDEDVAPPMVAVNAAAEDGTLVDKEVDKEVDNACDEDQGPSQKEIHATPKTSTNPDGHLPFGTMDEDDFLPLPISQLTKKRKPKMDGAASDYKSSSRPKQQKKLKNGDKTKGAKSSEALPSAESIDKQAAIDKYATVFAQLDSGRGRGRGRGRDRGRGGGRGGGGRGGKKQDNVGFIIPEGHFNPMSRLFGDGQLGPKGSSKRSATQVRSGNRSSTYRPKGK